MKNIGQTIINKIPKILLIIVILFGLGVNKNLLFGNQIKPEKDSEIGRLTTTAEKKFNLKVTLKTNDDVLFEVHSKNGGNTIGYILTSTKFSSVKRGYAGKTPIAVFMDENKNITSVELLKNSETPSFIKILQRNAFFDKWIGQNINDSIIHPDAISGVTLSSNSIIANFDAAIRHIHVKEDKRPFDWGTFMPQAAVLVVVILSLICYFLPAKTRKFRLPVLILSVVVLGVWQGAFVQSNYYINGYCMGCRSQAGSL